MKTFHKWLEVNHPEELDEGMVGNFTRALALGTGLVTGSLGMGQQAQAAPPKSVVQRAYYDKAELVSQPKEVNNKLEVVIKMPYNAEAESRSPSWNTIIARTKAMDIAVKYLGVSENDLTFVGAEKTPNNKDNSVTYKFYIQGQQQ